MTTGTLRAGAQSTWSASVSCTPKASAHTATRRLRARCLRRARRARAPPTASPTARAATASRRGTAPLSRRSWRARVAARRRGPDSSARATTSGGSGFYTSPTTSAAGAGSMHPARVRALLHVLTADMRARTAACCWTAEARRGAAVALSRAAGRTARARSTILSPHASAPSARSGRSASNKNQPPRLEDRHKLP